MAQKFSNSARAILASTINNTDTALTIESGGALFPIANTGSSAISSAADWFKLVLQDLEGIEVIYVRTHTSSSASFSNILRGQEGTTAREFLAGSVVGLRPTSGDADHVNNTSNPHGVTKSQVGLGNVDNTSDANKPISTATQTALDGKSATSHDHSGVYQPLDADLTAIAALAGTSGLLKKTAANTWSLDTATYLTANQTITFSGDVSGSGTTSIAVTLNTVPVSKGGTGATTLTGVLKGNGTSAFSAATVGTDYARPDTASTWTANQTFNQITETVYSVVDAAGVAISPTNGPIQAWVLGGNRTPTLGTWNSGQSLTLMVADGTAYAVTWTTMGIVWVGGTAPTLPTTGYAVIELWKADATIYGAYVGNVA